MPSPLPESSSRPQRDSPPPRRRSRSRSRSPRRDAVRSEHVHLRSRSRSPPRMPREKNFSGLKWKRHDRRESDRDRDDRRGGYGRDRYEDDRRRGYGRDEPRGGIYGGRGRNEDFGDRQRRGDRDHYERGGRDGDDRRGQDRRREDRDRKPKEEKPKPVAAPAPVAPGQEMIIVTVNDRLGTKAQIPCLASDPIKVFKAMVAARIGRAPHEIMLKRQGERPMKDALTLEDYGVSNGVQLDLELGTGD